MTIGPHTPMPDPIVLTERGVGARIREARNRRRFRQVDLADLAFIHPVRLSAIERSKASPSANEMVRLAQALGVSPRDFFPAVRAFPPSPLEGEGGPTGPGEGDTDNPVGFGSAEDHATPSKRQAVLA